MQLSSRKSKLISELLDNESCVTGQYLANVAGVTSRTVRGDIAELNNELCEYDIQILSISGKGYYIPMQSKSRLSELVKIQKDYIIPILPNARVEHIIKQLLLNPKGVNLDTISNHLYVSKSTLDRDLMKVNEKLQECDLKLEKRKGNVAYIKGNELDIREMYREFFEKAIKAHLLDSSFSNDDINIIFNSIKKIIVEIVEETNAELSGDNFNAVIIFLTIAVFRNINGYSISSYDKRYSAKDVTTNKIIERINKETKLNNFEKKYIQSNIKKYLGTYDVKENLEEIDNVLNKCVSEVSTTYNFELTKVFNEKLTSILCNCFETKSTEISLSDIKKEHPLAFEMAVSLISSINHKIHIKVTNQVLAKIVLLIACEMEQDMIEKERKNRDVVVVCQSGEILKNLIQTKLNRYFPEFNIIGFYPLYRLNKALELKPDMIISTVMINNEDIPVIVINPLFKDYDIIKINTVIRQIEHRESISYDFINLFREDLFLKDVDVVDKHDAIKKLFDILKKGGYAEDTFFQAIVERENIAPTAIGNMVAVPHAIGNNFGDNVVAIAILRNPVDWNGEKVQLVFEINIQNATDGNVKQIFKSFFDIISSNRKVDRLIKSKNYYEFIKTINQ